MQRSRSWRGSTEGEYTVVRRWRWAAAAARVYEAFHRRTGAPALLLRPGRPGDWKPAAAPWEARVVSTPTALALELKPGNVRQPEQLQEVTLGLQRLANALAQVEDEPRAQEALVGGVARMRRKVVRGERWRARPAYVVALACAAMAAVVAAPRATVAPHAAPQGAVTTVQLAPAVSLEEPVTIGPRMGPWVLARDMPKGPFEGQARPSKDGKCEGRYERAINGGCWFKLDAEAPCDDRSYEHKGGCYIPAYPPIRAPQAARP